MVVCVAMHDFGLTVAAKASADLLPARRNTGDRAFVTRSSLVDYLVGGARWIDFLGPSASVQVAGPSLPRSPFDAL